MKIPNDKGRYHSQTAGSPRAWKYAPEMVEATGSDYVAEERGFSLAATMAQNTVQQAIQQLRSMGVAQPTRIPWGR
jgi:hypothetical protein